MSAGSPLVFVVDDDVSVRRALGRLIRSAGLRVRTFASAQEFLDGADWGESGCLVLDIRMPGMNGLDLQQQILASSHSLPVIILTAREDLESYERAMKQGAKAYLRKPCDDRALLDAVFAALSLPPSPS